MAQHGWAPSARHTPPAEAPGPREHAGERVRPVYDVPVSTDVALAVEPGRSPAAGDAR